MKVWTKNAYPIEGWQFVLDEMDEIGLTAEDGMRQVWFITADGYVSGGAEAANLSLRYVWWLYPFTFLYYVPGIRQIQNWLYRWVANNRYKLPGGTAACEVPPPKGNQ